MILLIKPFSKYLTFSVISVEQPRMRNIMRATLNHVTEIVTDQILAKQAIC